MEDIVKEDKLVTNPSVEEVKEMMDSVKLKEDPEDEHGPFVDVGKEERRPVVVDTKGVDPETMELYHEFSEFLVQKAEIVEDAGVKKTIPTGIDVLDAILGGGFGVGALNIIVGQPGSGKSMLAIQAMAGGQNTYKGLLAAFLDSEEATTTTRLSNLGVKNPKIKPITDVTVEKVFKLLETVCVFKGDRKIDTPSMVVWDSIANTLSIKEREAEDINAVIGYKARLLSLLVPKYVAKCSTYNIAWIAVNQLRDEMQLTQYGPPRDLKFMSSGKSMPGGNVLKFNAFTLLEMKLKGALDANKIGFDGILVRVKTVKGKLFPPNVEVDLVGSFLTGFSNFHTNYRFLAESGRLSTGAWNFLKAYPEKKFRTKDAEEVYNTDKKFKEEWDKAVKEAIDIDIIQKYAPEIE